MFPKLLVLLLFPAWAGDLPSRDRPVVVPPLVIAGDEVRVLVWSGGGAGCRLVSGPRVRRVRNVFHVDVQMRGTCDGPAGVSLALGKLKEGVYHVESRGTRARLVVEPPHTDPGDLPLERRVQLAVADARRPGRCFGMPGPGPSVESLRRGVPPLVLRQLRKAYPDRPERDLLLLLDAATSVSVTETTPGEWTYALRDGRCCKVDEVVGMATVDPNGKVTVGEPRIVKSDSMPC
jgi:hypothetical protein